MSAALAAVLALLAGLLWPRKHARRMRRLSGARPVANVAALAARRGEPDERGGRGELNEHGGLRAVLAADPLELWRERRARRRAGPSDLVPTLDQLAVALRAGLPVTSAVEAVADVAPRERASLSRSLLEATRDDPIDPSHPAQRVQQVQQIQGASVASRLKQAAADHGDPALGFVAAAWQLSDEHGAPLADAVSHGAAQARRRSALATRISVAVAGPLATVRVLMVLPLAGPLFGLAVGLSPVEQYVGSPAAAASAVTGAGLVLAGRAWCRRMIRRVLPPGVRGLP